MVRLREADASSWPLGENAIPLTPAVWLSSLCVCPPVAGFQILTVRLREADASS